MTDTDPSLTPDRSLLQRVLEAEVMDSVAEACDYDAMDHGEVNRRFAADFLAALSAAGLADDAEVLDLGTGTAQIPIELCRQNPRLRVVAVDMSRPMLELAARNVAAAGLDARIRLEQADAKRLPLADGTCAAIISNSIVHHIPKPAAVLAELVRVTRAGGLVFVRDLSRPRDDEQVKTLVATYAGACNDHQRQLFDDSLRAALSVEEIRALVLALGFDAGSVRATSDRHWTWSSMKR